MTTTTATERCINLKPWEVRAYRERRLTQLWRPIKPQPFSTATRAELIGTSWRWCEDVADPNGYWVSQEVPCPYGQPGGVLLGRECWASAALVERGAATCFAYQADDEWTGRTLGHKWHPATRMPRHAVRNRMPLLAVRVTRLGEMSVMDARESGIAEYLCEMESTYTEMEDDVWRNRTSVENFAAIWERDHGAGSWREDLWCWVLGVERFNGGDAS